MVLIKKKDGKRVKPAVVNEMVVKVKQLEKQVAEGPEHANNLVDLLEIAEGSNLKGIHAASNALYRLFSGYMEKGELGQLKGKGDKKPKLAAGTVGVKDAQSEFREWLHTQYLDFIRVLLAQLDSKQASIQAASLQILMQFVEAESLRLKQSSGHVFPNTLFRRIIFALMSSTNYSEELRTLFVNKYLLKYDDVRFYMLKNLTAFMTQESTASKKSHKLEVLSTRIFHLLQPINFPRTKEDLNAFLSPVLPQDEPEESNSDSDDETPSRKRKNDTDEKESPLLVLKNHRKVFGECWLSLLRLPLTGDCYKRVLIMLHKEILPFLDTPKLLIDFLTVSYDKGGVISVLALNGLFVLMTEHNLDYPHFYEKVYKLLDREIFCVKYRDRFFHLCGQFMQSILLPSYLVAAFAKRLTRLALYASPSGIAFVLPFVYNLLMKHPQCMAMIHRECSVGTDPFIMTEADPAKCRALESSLWELEALREHYLPQLNTFGNIFSETFKDKELNVDEFLDQDYSSMLTQVMAKRVKADIATEFTKPAGVLSTTMTT
eukprot:Ihof_evm3s193 gene=Ihof_evmTU3s193